MELDVPKHFLQQIARCSSYLEIYRLVFHRFYLSYLETAKGFLTLQCVTDGRKVLYLPCKRSIGRLQINHLSVYIVGAFILEL